MSYAIRTISGLGDPAGVPTTPGLLGSPIARLNEKLTTAGVPDPATALLVGGALGLLVGGALGAILFRRK